MYQFQYDIKPGRYRHFKGNEYQVIEMARHSETKEEMGGYRPLYGEGGLWVRPAAMWAEEVERDGKRQATTYFCSRAALLPAISTSAGLTARPRSAGS